MTYKVSITNAVVRRLTSKVKKIYISLSFLCNFVRLKPLNKLSVNMIMTNEQAKCRFQYSLPFS